MSHLLSSHYSASVFGNLISAKVELGKCFDSSHSTLMGENSQHSNSLKSLLQLHLQTSLASDLSSCCTQNHSRFRFSSLTPTLAFPPGPFICRLWQDCKGSFAVACILEGCAYKISGQDNCWVYMWSFCPDFLCPHQKLTPDL